VNLIILSAICAVVSLDRKHIFQLSISQPLVTSTLIGFLLGSPSEAMYFGMIIQLLWLSNLHIGAAKTPEGEIASIIGCILYVKFHDQFFEYGNFLLFFTFLFTVLCSFFANLLGAFSRKVDVRFFDFSLKSIKESNKGRIGISICLALIFQFIINLVFIFIAVSLGSFILKKISGTIENISIDVWQFVVVAILGSGVGMLISVFRDKKSKRSISVLSILVLIILISI